MRGIIASIPCIPITVEVCFSIYFDAYYLCIHCHVRQYTIRHNLTNVC